MAGRQPFQCRAHPGVGRPARAARVTSLTERPGNAGPVRPGGWYEGHGPFLPVTVTAIKRSCDYFGRTAVRKRPNVPGTGQYMYPARANTSTGNAACSVFPAKPPGMARLSPWRAGDLLAGLGVLAGRGLAWGGNG